MPQAHEVDYKVYGDDMQFVEIELDPEEAAIAEAGSDFGQLDVVLGVVRSKGRADQADFDPLHLGGSQRAVANRGNALGQAESAPDV